MDEWVISVVVALVGAGFGAGIAQFLSNRKQRIGLTMDLFRTYHGPAMVGSRNAAWRYLNVDYLESDRPAFHELFAHVNETGTSHYDDLIQVLYFWHLLYCLQREGAIQSALARDFFGYQFAHWRNAIKPLFEATIADRELDDPEWCELMAPKAMDWLRPVAPE